MGKFGPKPNSSRVKWDWPPRELNSGKLKKSALKMQKDELVCGKLVGIGSDILKKELKLHLTNNEEGISPCTDIDGNIYTTIEIGDQLWMRKNLKVK